MLAAYYDLARSPPTYDVVSFLCAVEGERILRGENYVDIFFLPGPDDGFRKDKVWPFTIAERERMRDKVAVPICRLLPSARSVQLFKGNRPTKGLGVGQTLHMWREFVEGCRKGIRPLRASCRAGPQFSDDNVARGRALARAQQQCSGMATRCCGLSL